MAEAKARTVLWYLVFIGFAVNYMIRINLNITIVDMVAQAKSSSKNRDSQVGNGCSQVSATPLRSSGALSTEADYVSSDQHFISVSDNELKNNILVRPAIDYHQLNHSVSRKDYFAVERVMLKFFNVNYDQHGFNWNEYQQGLVLGSFFWIHWVTQIPGGILAKKYGTKLIFGLANLFGCWICFLLPIVSYWDYRALILLRVFQGLVCGLAWPAMHHMTAQWIPPNERSNFVTAYLGSSVGIAVFYPLFGYIISWSSWEWVFHLCGIIGSLWYIAWLLFVFDTPAQHPRITESERKFIEKSLGASIQSRTEGSTPWKDILTSRAVWMNVIAQWGGIWGLFTLMTQAPTYFKIIHGWDIKMTGILSGIPHMMRMIFAYFFSLLGDYLLRSGKMSRSNVRKLATTMCCIVKGIFVLALAYSGCNSTAAIVFLTLATAVHGAVSTGPLASIVDIAPNYAGIVLGISGMVGVLPGFISPVIVGILTFGNQTVTSWKYVFLITAGMLVVSGVLYVLLCESDIQKWNSPEDSKERELQEIISSKLTISSKVIKPNDDKHAEENDVLLGIYSK